MFPTKHNTHIHTDGFDAISLSSSRQAASHDTYTCVVSSVVSHLTSYMQPLPAAAAHQPASYPVRSIVIR